MMQFSKEEKKELKELYGKLRTLYEERANMEVLRKEREDKLKDEFAFALDLKNKQGELQSSKVKMPLVSALIDELYKDKPNKKEIEYELMQEYKNLIKNKKINEEALKAMISAEESLEENISFIKEAYKESTFCSKESLDALTLILKDEFKLLLSDAYEKAGYETKAIKDKAELERLSLSIKELLGI
ncbi:hypothetical protein ABV837_001029 [Campylobacter upsaliensis]|uniref:Uncharacterized protein n=2 Tax=Campylobacter upsaliensis TaxID=28080 RepID=A0A828QVQ2_CAMUP|nr:hypothetical protein [Campylobacter upsaliensis]EFU71117.1 hypothetical protein HMPREF9400_1647 [Campylobacter upsaliensis JV21]EAH8338438.1 hypothetical protein [Campylobacter upsaliensis]EAH9135643.1 hypothetical protein [Campylobacter upsaliensis]EAH9147211.1 hypothetical protein [Campylobacter upsaliensis]EAI5602809.1 hypothetical protein [Campylobacter upsaliensis]